MYYYRLRNTIKITITTTTAAPESIKTSSGIMGESVVEFVVDDVVEVVGV